MESFRSCFRDFHAWTFAECRRFETGQALGPVRYSRRCFCLGLPAIEPLCNCTPPPHCTTDINRQSFPLSCSLLSNHKRMRNGEEQKASLFSKEARQCISHFHKKKTHAGAMHSRCNCAARSIFSARVQPCLVSPSFESVVRDSLSALVAVDPSHLSQNPRSVSCRASDPCR